MAEQLVKITVNGQEVEAEAGDLLLHVLRDAGIRVPTLCHDERLTPYGGCRLCIVERTDGRGGMVPACSTPVLPGMIVESDTSAVVESRRRQLQFLVANHRMECPVCDRRGDCRFQDLIYEYGAPEDELPFEMIRRPRVDNSPVIARDPEKCIVCGKCARLCEEVQGVAAIGIVNRGLDAHVTTHLDLPLDCEFCGQCVNACPVGALVLDTPQKQVPVWLRTERRTTCSFCSCACQISAQIHEGEVLKVAGDETVGPNHGKLCAKGWLGWDVLTSSERLTKPLVRKDGRLEGATWDAALDAAAAALKGAREKNGSGIVGIGSSRLTNEDAYLMQRLWRVGLGTPNVTVGPTGGVSGLVDAIETPAGRAAGTAGFDELRAADVVFVVRGDPTRTHPLVKTEIVQGVRQRDQELLLANTVSGGLEDHASCFVELPPGGESALLRAVSARFLDRRPDLASALSERPGFVAWADSLAAWTPEAAAGALGISFGTIDRLVDRLLAARQVVTVVVTALGLAGDEAEVTADAARLVELADAGDRQQASLMVLGERANVRGVLDVGLHERLLPGHRPVSDDAARAVIESAWGASIPSEPGASLEAIGDMARSGGVGVLYLVGQDPLSGWPRALDADGVLAGAATTIVQDAFLTSTARRADVVLPVSILAERSGTVTGVDGVARALVPVVDAPGGVPQDGDVLREVARRAGIALPEADALDAERGGLVAWPAPERSTARFEAVAAPEPHARRAGILLDLSPILFHSGTTTHRSERLCELAPLVALRVAPEDASTAGVANGQLVRISADAGEALLRARVDGTVRPGTAVATSSNGRESATSLLELNGDDKRVNMRRSE